MRESMIMLVDRRELSIADYGAEDGPAVLYFHGAPSSRLDALMYEDEIDASGIRVVAIDRPGFGGSSPQPGRVLADWPNSVAQVADQLGLESFAVVGASAGGVHAIACAALLADRVTSLGLVCAGTDPSWPGTASRHSDEENSVMATDDEETVIAWFAGRFGADASRYPIGGAGLPAPDAAMFDDARYGPGIVSSTKEALRQGVAGLALDKLVRSRPWTFDPGSIDARCEIIHGEQDTVAPVANGEHNATLIPNATLTRLPEHGHLSILTEIPRLATRLTTT